jgi:guanylate kinase
MNTGNLLMVAAPSGAGKSSLVAAFLKDHADWALSVSTTTRPPRPGEAHGREYLFTTQEDFKARQQRGEFLEWAQVHGNFYGTSRQWIEDQLAAAKNIILEIDWQGAQQIRRLFAGRTPAPASVFIMPPSIDTLEQRLRARGQDSEAVIRQRVAAAQDEISHAHEFDYVIINQEFSVALAEFACFAQALCKGSQTSKAAKT